MSRISKSTLMGICTAAVGAIYAAGYVYTEPSAQANGLSPSTSVATAAKSHQAGSSPSSTHTHSSSSAGNGQSRPQHAASKGYKDGVYTGNGSNPYGTLSVAVRIAQGKIASVKITSYYMHYPQMFIDPQLPHEVLSMQTWRIYIVSGATASSYNFAEAVYQALQKAKA